MLREFEARYSFMNVSKVPLLAREERRDLSTQHPFSIIWVDMHLVSESGQYIQKSNCLPMAIESAAGRGT